MVSRPTLLVLRSAAFQPFTATTTPPTRNFCASTSRVRITSLGVFNTTKSQNHFSTAVRLFSTTKSAQAKNRIFTSVRNPDELQNYILSSTSSRKPLITLWTASYCPTCKVVAPIVQRLVESGVGESTSSDGDRSVLYAEVEYDSPDMMQGGMGMQYMISSLPTLMTFDRGEVITDTKVTDGKQLSNETFLKEWIEKESQRRGEGTGGSGGGFFGGLFGSGKK